MKILIVTLFTFVFLAQTQAQTASAETNPDSGSQIHVLIEPIIGYQTLERSYPYDHNEGMLTYGARVVVGTDELAGEAEMQFGSSSESFNTPPVEIDTSFTMARLGARKVFPVSDPVHIMMRAGMEGYHYSNTYNVLNQNSTTDSPAWQFRPYVGGGLIFYLFKSLSFSVEEVYVVDTSWETGFGFRLYL